MNENQIEMAIALANCKFPPGGTQAPIAYKLAVKAMYAPDTQLTEREVANLITLFHAYRDQIRTAHDKYCMCPPAVEARSKFIGEDVGYFNPAFWVILSIIGTLITIVFVLVWMAL